MFQVQTTTSTSKPTIKDTNHRNPGFETLVLTLPNQLYNEEEPHSTNRTFLRHRHESEGEDLFVNFRGLLILGRILGVIPISGVFKSKSYKNLKYSLLSTAGIFNLTCIALLAFNAVLAIGRAIQLDKRNVLEVARSIGNPLFASWGLLIYVMYSRKCYQFLKIFKLWGKCTKDLVYTKKDLYLDRYIILICVVLFTSTVLENAVLHLEYFKYFDDINGHVKRWGRDDSNASVFIMYYWRSHHYWYQMIGYHPIFVVLVFLIHKWILYGWNYSDVLSALFFRALYFKFKALYETAKERLVKIYPLVQTDRFIASQEDQQAWTQLAKDHNLLREILKGLNDFFSPIVFASYAVNIYFICMQLLVGLTPDVTQNSLVHSIYAPWSFFHIIIRIFFFSYFAAKINDYVHKISEVVMRCPTEFYNAPVAKLEKLVNSSQKLGLSGLGCFVITKPFMLGILNVVFTIEIVLLQAPGIVYKRPN